MSVFPLSSLGEGVSEDIQVFVNFSLLFILYKTEGNLEEIRGRIMHRSQKSWHLQTHTQYQRIIAMFQVFIRQSHKQEFTDTNFQVYKLYSYFFALFLSFHFKCNLDEFYQDKFYILQ